MKRDLFKDAFNIPNILSIIRILLIPFFIASLHASDGNYTTPIIILLISFATDVLDGYIARKYNMTSELGKLLDPGADKLTQLAIIYAFYKAGMLPLYILMIVIMKESIQVIGALYFKNRISENMIPSNIFGKTATGMFYFSVVLILLKVERGFLLLYISVVIMIIALISYMYEFLKVYKNEKRG